MKQRRESACQLHSRFEIVPRAQVVSSFIRDLIRRMSLASDHVTDLVAAGFFSVRTVRNRMRTVPNRILFVPLPLPMSAAAS